MERLDSSTSTARERQMEVGKSSTSSARQDKRDPQNPFHGITPQASSSSSTVMKKGPWDVFINHRGCDTKHKLASTIYHTLHLLGLHAFLDERELELGDPIPEEIKEAMQTAGLHIAIFSKNYAQSPWCLAELCFMLETGTPILPVFYHVQPDDLRWVSQGKGCYAPAFSKHQKKGRYPLSKLKEWKTALERVSNLSGYVLNENNGDEGMLLKSIVNSVLKAIKKEPLEVAKHPVGMDEMVEDFEISRQVEIVGIVGFGGSGKTTLATELYNRKISSFDRSSFLHDVRDAASKNALHTKQKKLLDDLRIQADPFDNQRDGKRALQKKLISLQVLIVLDDVDHQEQLDALLLPKESLGSGSLVIVTTREGDVLKNCPGVTSIYKMRPLQHFYAKELFCWHAFLQDSPKEGFEDLVEDYLDVCNGLPLSLKVIGGQLYGKMNKDYWYSQLDKIRKILPNEILQRFKVSYDALDEEEKEIFLDIACFFIGERPSSAIAVWEGSGWSGLCNWERLLNKCLVEVVEEYGEECIRMHDHLRDLGREIAKKHSPSRIWSEKQSMHIQRGMPIRGIMDATEVFGGGYRFFEGSTHFKEYMEMMRISNVKAELKLLLVVENDFTEECGELSRGLRWLRWFEFQHNCIPSWLSLENIRVLEFIQQDHALEALWEDANPPLQLRELLIEHAFALRSLPKSIGRLEHLKRLSLVSPADSCFCQLESLPEEFCQLHSLEHLDLEECVDLGSLPIHFGELVKLRHINLKSCSSLDTLPVSFKQLTRLEYLDLSSCHNLTLESDILENITNLKVFDVSYCHCVQVLPHNITNQASLRKLGFRGPWSLKELPASIGQLSKLEELIIDDCPMLTRLPTSLGNMSSLATLIILNCKKLYEIPSLASLVSLKNLCVSNCPKIMKIEGLEHLTSVEKLVVSTDGTISGTHSLRGTERLQMVKLKAGNISDFEAYIQSIEIEKWPRDMTVCGRIFSGAQSILESFTFPGLAVVDSFVQPMTRWSLTCQEANLSNAAIVCFLVPSSRIPYGMSDPTYDISSYNLLFNGSYGDWILLSVYREVSAPSKGGGRYIQASISDFDNLGNPFGGWLIVGERGSVVEGFKQLFQTLSASSNL